ncbi:MAG: OmpA family protein [Winogradskyella sp.]
MNRNIFIGLLLIYTNINYAQLKVSNTSGAKEIMSVLLGDAADLIVNNITINGNKKAFGIFTANLKYNSFLSKGIIMSTGIAKDAIGPNDDSKKSSKINFLSDKDINVIAEHKGCYDTALFEFDLSSTTDEIQFRFCFASEEYPEYILKNVNDAFIFLVTNTETQTSENIALLNGNQNYPITVDHINPQINSEYYIENTSYNRDNLKQLNNNLAKLELSQTFQYDGFTTVLVAKTKVIPNTIYHFKLGISDVGDQLYDSAIFLEANSLRSTGNKPKLEDELKHLKAILSSNFSIQFETASSKITGDNSFLLLDKILNTLKNDTEINIIIVGHTDRTGTKLYNNKLSSERAKSVRDYLIKSEIKANRVTTKGMGERQPISEDSYKNRRVEVIFSK